MMDNLLFYLYSYPADKKWREDVLRDMADQTEETVHKKSFSLDDRLKQVSI